MDERGQSEKAITITYSIISSSGDIDRISEEIALEQTVEVPKDVIGDRRILDEVVGRVISIDEDGGVGGNRFTVKIAYPEIVSNFEVPQFLNLLYGNISFKSGVRIIDIAFSGDFLLSFKGPKFGIRGIRELTGVFGRPLVSTARSRWAPLRRSWPKCVTASRAGASMSSKMITASSISPFAVSAKR